jgi:hypothetical protein
MNPVTEPGATPYKRGLAGDPRSVLERLRNQPLGIRARQAANMALTVALGGPLGLIHVVEYPKCGGSWVRNMLQTYTGTGRFLEQRLLRPGDVVQVHRLPQRWLRRPVVVTRDPRDMYVSFYYHETQYRNREKHLAIERYFQHDPNRPLKEDFAVYLEARLTQVTHPSFPLSTFVRAWQSQPGVVWVRYGDCLDDGERELTRVVRELGLSLDPQRVRHAVEANSFEAATRARGQQRRPGETDPGAFERKGISGDWKNHFDRRSCELVERHEGWSLRTLGYERDGGWVERFLKA